MHSLKVPMMMNGFLSIHPDPQPAKITPALTTEQTTANLQMTKNTQAHTLDTRRRLHRVPKLASSVVKGSHSPCSLAHVSGWGAGWNVGAGLIIKISMFTKNFSLVPELTFNYRQYNYEKDMDVYTNKAKLNIMLFELPIMFRYTFEQYDFFAAAGLHLGLKLMGDTEFSSEANGGVVTGNADKSTNTFVSTNMEVGMAIEGGYMLTRNIHLNLRVVQCFTNPHLLHQRRCIVPVLETVMLSPSHFVMLSPQGETSSEILRQDKRGMNCRDFCFEK